MGCADGSVRLHSVQSEQPLLEWCGSTAGEEVVSVQWALTRPAVFCVLDAASCLHLWDLVEDEQRPVLTERIHVDRSVQKCFSTVKTSVCLGTLSYLIQ